MRMKALNPLSVLVLTGLCVLSFAPRTLAQSENWRSDGNLLEGTWIVQVTRHDCQSGAVLSAPFLSLLTFARGGTHDRNYLEPHVRPAHRTRSRTRSVGRDWPSYVLGIEHRLHHSKRRPRQDPGDHPNHQDRNEPRQFRDHRGHRPIF